METLTSGIQTIGFALAAMAVVMAIETLAPLHSRGPAGRRHLRPNLTLAAITLAANLAFNVALLWALDRAAQGGFGLLPTLSLPPLLEIVLVVLALDLSFYATHVLMHHVPGLWRFHRVHHSDAALDVTTTLRQHPVEGVVRYVALAAVALPLGATPIAFGAYRTISVLAGLLSHANVRAPLGIARALSWVVPWPHVHKVHHSRDPRFTDTNYGNVVTWWDRLFGTFTPSDHGVTVRFGLDDFEEATTRSAVALLRSPWKARAVSPRTPDPRSKSLSATFRRRPSGRHAR